MNTKNDEFIILESTAYFITTLERLWSLIRDWKLILLFYKNNEFKLNVNSLEKSYIKGNVIEGTILDIIKFKVKCENVILTPFCKIIKWRIFLNEYENPIASLKFFILKCTHKKNTILFYSKTKVKKSVFGILGSTQENCIENYTISMKSNLETMQKFLSESSFNLIQYESCLIETAPSNVWEFLETPSKIKNLAPLYCLDFTMESEKIELGRMLKIINCKKDGYVIFKVAKIIKGENWKKWMVKLNYMFSVPPLQISEVIATIQKVSKERCQVSVMHIFSSGVDIEILEKISCTKKYLLSSLKDFFENYQR